MEGMKALSSRTLVLMVTYGVASASMLVVNKAAITIIPEPSLLLLTQVGSTALLVLVPALLGVTPQRVQIAPERRVALAYLMVAAVFLGTIYSNIRMLQYIGVNTFIVLRCSTPLVVSVLDWALMGRQLPSRRSAAALTGVLLCGAAYAWLKSQSMHEAQRTTLQGSSMSGDAARSGLFWTACWFGFFLADMLFIKHICDSYPCNGLERTLYQNGLATPMLALAFLTSSDGAHSVNEATARLTSETAGVAMVLASCLAGLVLSYAGLSLRSEISSTAFTVLGVVCKMGSIVLNELFVEPEGDLLRLLVVAGVIVCSSQYKQAPKRDRTPESGDGTKEDDNAEDAQPLVNVVKSDEQSVV